MPCFEVEIVPESAGIGRHQGAVSRGDEAGISPDLPESAGIGQRRSAERRGEQAEIAKISFFTFIAKHLANAKRYMHFA